MGATVSHEFGMGLQRGVFNNFVVETLGIQPGQLGLVQGIREIPGLLTAPLAIVSGYYRENVWAGICLAITAAGLLCHVFASSFALLIVATLVMSVGFHLFYPVQQSMVMKNSLREERATHMGLLNSGGAAAALAAFFVVMGLAKVMKRPNYSLVHSIASASALLGGVLVAARRLQGVDTRARSPMEFNARYMSYYVLSFLGGSRRHVTMTFAGYLLVRTFGTPVSTMVLLSAISSLVAIFTRPLIGKVIDRWGEQRSLVFNYAIVSALFASYAFVKIPMLLYAIYVLDQGLQGFDVAITTHLGKIARFEALSPAYAMGSTINHISGVAVPVIGGYLWDYAGAPVVFLSGAGIALASLLYSARLERRESLAGQVM
jgi:MFS family permease